MKTLDQTKRIHVVGIGGIGTSSLAFILNKKGKKISGSDNCPSLITSSLKKAGIKIFLEHKKENIKKNMDLIIYSPAIPATNPEIKEAKKLKIKIMSYPQALGELTKDYYTIAVAGTHGKSTTTAITSLILQEGGLDPSVVIGTKMKELDNKNFRVGESNYLVVEACEYKRSFLHLDPNILIVTNIEADHLDYYKNLTDYISAFKKLAQQLPEDGALIINSDDKNSEKITKNLKCQVIRWSYKKGYDFQLNEQNLSFGDIKIKLKPNVKGKFNIENSAFAAICGNLLNVQKSKIEKAINNFSGTWRRMEYKKVKLPKTKFIDDYGHHPTEIQMTLTALREIYPKEKILCIFQPHQYSRTHLLLKDFGRSFNLVDEVIIPNIYKVRDSKEDLKKVSTDILVKEIKKHNKHVKNGGGLDKTAEYIKKHYKNYDIIITMGAGDIDKIYDLL